MDKIRNYEELRKKLDDSLRYYEHRVDMWSKVKVVTKKDGTPFKDLSRNFEGADVGKYSIVEGWSNPYLSVHGSYDKPSGGYEFEEDQIEIHISQGRGHSYVQYKGILPEHNEEREVRGTMWGYDNEVLTIEEIQIAIDHHIEKMKGYVEQIKKDIEKSEEIYNEVHSKLLEISALVFSDEYGNSLKYGLQGHVQSFDSVYFKS